MPYWILSAISFDSTATLLSRGSILFFLFTVGLSLKLKCLEELVTAIAVMHNVIRAEEKR
jgi:hypothetical protein